MRRSGAIALESPEVIRIAWKHFGWHQSACTTDARPGARTSPTSRPARRGRAEDTTNSRGAPGAPPVNSETHAHDTDVGQHRPQPRKLPAAAQQAGTARRRLLQPLHRWIDEDESADAIRPPGGIRANDEAAERMANQNDAFIGCRPIEHDGQLVDDARERPGR
jgi:hypothetical protein